jgi:hypothetical protein
LRLETPKEVLDYFDDGYFLGSILNVFTFWTAPTLANEKWGLASPQNHGM